MSKLLCRVGNSFGMRPTDTVEQYIIIITVSIRLLALFVGFCLTLLQR